MLKPLISCYGISANPFVNYIRSDYFVEKILSGDAETNGRAYCYQVNSAIRNIMDNAANAAGVSAIDYEVFAPNKVYPPHKDSGVVTLAIPLTDDAILTVYNSTVKLEKWNLYSFDDGFSHNSAGVFVMARIKN